jgi:micrococcal nuclease
MLLKRWFVILLLLLFLNLGCQDHPRENLIRAKIKRVVSGQTIEVLVENRPYKLRLTGVNVPSVAQKPWGSNAKKFLIDTLMNQPTSSSLFLETDVTVTDKFGRLQGYVWLQDQLINEKLVEQGHAIVNLTYTDGRYDQKLLNAQNYARLMGKGIWNPQQPLKEFNSTSQTSSQ